MFIQLPDDFVAQVASTSQSITAGLWPLAELVIGVLLALLLVGGVISFIRHR